MGPLLMSRLLGLNDTQTGVLCAVFKIADENGLALLDFKDLSEMLKFVYENSSELSALWQYIQQSAQRSLLVLEQQGAKEFFQGPLWSSPTSFARMRKDMESSMSSMFPTSITARISTAHLSSIS